MSVNMKNWQELKKPMGLETKPVGDDPAGRQLSSPNRWSAALA